MTYFTPFMAILALSTILLFMMIGTFKPIINKYKNSEVFHKACGPDEHEVYIVDYYYIRGLNSLFNFFIIIYTIIPSILAYYGYMVSATILTIFGYTFFIMLHLVMKNSIKNSDSIRSFNNFVYKFKNLLPPLTFTVPLISFYIEYSGGF